MRDQSVDHRVDRYLSNSPVIDRRIWKFYKRKSTILYPPLDLDSYYHNDDNDFFFHLGLMDKEKGVPEIVNAFSSRAERIVFAGGRGEIKDKVIEQIKRASNMEYLGFVDEEQKYELLSNCRAVIFNGVNEDFGIVPIEANASGKPCLVRNDGFPSIFVEDGYNGLIHDGTPAGIRRSLDRMDELNPNRTDFESLVEQFSLNTFEQRLRAVLAEEYKQMQRRFDAPSHEIYTADNR